MATDGTTAPAANTPPQADPPIQWDGDRMYGPVPRLVVSPLLALIADQVMHLREAGGEFV